MSISAARRWLAVGACTFLAGCGGGSALPSPADTSLSEAAMTDAPLTDDALSEASETARDGLASDAAELCTAAPNAFTGAVFGAPLAPIKSVLSSRAGSTLTVFLVAGELTCDQAANAGWSTRLPNQTQIVHIVVDGTSAGQYTLSDPRPPGGAEVVLHVSSPDIPNPTQHPDFGRVTICSPALGHVFARVGAEGTDGAVGVFRPTECSKIAAMR